MLFVGVTGATLFVLAVLEKRGVSINGGMIRFVAETFKYGGLLYLVYLVFNLFL